jgi:hypothetical protein
MKSFLFVLALLASCVTALNAGIFGEGGSVVQPPDYVEENARRAEPFTPTPTERVTNGERLRRGLPLLPPSRRSSARKSSPRSFLRFSLIPTLP